MADYITRIVTTTCYEVALPSPTNWVELSKALAHVRAQRPDDGQEYDDTVTIEARNDEIVLWWKIPADRVTP